MHLRFPIPQGSESEAINKKFMAFPLMTSPPNVGDCIALKTVVLEGFGLALSHYQVASVLAVSGINIRLKFEGE